MRPPAYLIKVDGEEMDHADTLQAARVARDALIYGELGTMKTITIERAPKA